MTGMLIAFAIGYVLARNQENILALLTRKVEQDLQPPKDPPAK